MRLLTFSRVTSRKMREPLLSSVRFTVGSWVWLSKPGWASVRFSPVSTTCFLTITAWPLRSAKRSEPNGTGPRPVSAERPSTLSSTRRTSSVAVRPRMSLALAVSCTPGSCTTIRSSPCCWMTGSDTPSSLIRLCSVVMFCLRAWSCTLRAASGLIVAVRRTSAPSGDSFTTRSVNWSVRMLRMARAVWASGALIWMVWPSRLIPLWRTFLSRRVVRISPLRDSARLVSAPSISTWSMKCTPPRKSRPRYMGRAPMLPSQVGERESRFRATM